MPGIYRDLVPQVVFSGNALDNVSSFRWSLGYDQTAGEATVVCPTTPGGGSFFDDVSIIVGGTTRWSGVLYQFERNLYPRSVSLIAKGRMQLLADFKLQEEFSREEKGLHLEELLGSPTGTDEQIVSAVLDYVGVSTNGGSINGTGTVLGSIAPEAFIWLATDSALSYIQKIDAISLGYRTFESAAGAIYRTQITTVPSGGADYTFTEGEDIVQATSNRSVQDAYGAVRIGGYSVGDYADPRVWSATSGITSDRTFSWNNEMIERRANSSPGSGVSCEAIADYWLNELDHEIIKVTMTTPRDDVYGPGQIHRVDAPDRLSIGGTFFVQRCDGELRSDGAFSQSLTYIGAG